MLLVVLTTAVVMTAIDPPRPCQLMIKGARLNAPRITTVAISLLRPTQFDPTPPIAVTTPINNTMDGQLIHSYQLPHPPGNVRR